MNKLGIVFVALFFLVACTEENDISENNSQIDLLTPYTLDQYKQVFTDISVTNQSVLGNIKLGYSNGKLEKKIGYAYMHNVVNDNLYDTIYQNLDRVYIEKRIIPFNGFTSVAPDKIEYKFNQNRKIIYKVKHNLSFSLDDNDTILYSYLNNKINKLETRSKLALFYYNRNNNLDSICYKPKIYDDNYITYTIGNTYEKEVFEEYDNSENPFKQLTIFEDMFKRSLSNNNYRKHTVLNVNPYYIKYQSSIILQYNSEGKLIYK
ncbi:hypothetical protein [Flavobacterium facile]|uniref:hypothetical protein n=1 Tax=Flavobacterium facile TaxID=2893174 RepID=UPI002E7799D4|nr:hypothetical protein [Flavobacterium sp. T-12]